MRVEIGVKESFKKKLVRSTWAGHVEKIGDENLAGKDSRCPESGGETEARKTEIAMWIALERKTGRRMEK